MTSIVNETVALVTGGSSGLGLALSRALVGRGWRVVTDARGAEALAAATQALGDAVVAVPGDVTEAQHRAHLVELVGRLGRLDLLVHNASSLGPSPLPHLAAVTAAQLGAVLDTNLAAPLELTRSLLPYLAHSSGLLVSISSDAAVEHYRGWGVYGASKAALDHLTLTFGAEEGITAYAVDPGDMRTPMHQAAFPGEDISDRPLPESVVPRLLELFDLRPASGRYRLGALAGPAVPEGA